MIGGRVSDIELEKRVGGITILVPTGYGSQCGSGHVLLDRVVSGMEDAATLIEKILVGNDAGLGPDSQ